MQPDNVEVLGRSRIQHGPWNGRIYLVKLHSGDYPEILDRLEQLACNHGYGKIFAKVNARFEPGFREHGYRVEARVPGFYGGEEDALFLARYPDTTRSEPADRRRLEEIVGSALRMVRRRRSGDSFEEPEPPAPGASAEAPALLERGDAAAVSRLFSAIFRIYPVPVFDPQFIADCMANGSRYVGFRRGEELTAVGAAEIDFDGLNAEMTDFATLPSHRGRGYAGEILARLETELTTLGIRTAYTIARAGSLPMNMAFVRAGYRFGGMLPNNTRIGEGIETMNVWYKSL